MIFIDGLGVGSSDPDRNPLARHADIWATLGTPPQRPGLYFQPLDACLGVPGLPQSATGQTALLTGMNAPQILGRHLQGFPSRRLINIIEKRSIFVQLARYEVSATFANAYRHPDDIKNASRLSVTSHALKAGGQTFRRIDQIEAGQALFHEFTNRQLVEKGFQAPILSANEAADILLNIAKDQQFTLYEHFWTDVLGHRGDKQDQIDHVNLLTSFVRRVLEGAAQNNLAVLITSDHGNLEDSSIHTHTRNPVPLLFTNPNNISFDKLPETIAEIYDWILKWLNCPQSDEYREEILSA
jgi:2,3-bisphosphoglycerate-independent phosphoglycerate mutase